MRVTVIATGFDADKSNVKTAGKPASEEKASGEEAAPEEASEGSDNDIDDALGLFKKRSATPPRFNFT